MKSVKLDLNGVKEPDSNGERFESLSAVPDEAIYRLALVPFPLILMILFSQKMILQIKVFLKINGDLLQVG